MTQKRVNISNLIVDHLKTKGIFKGDNIFLVPGNEKRPSKTKLILVNTLFAMKDETTDTIEGYLNINIQDSDKIWIEYISEIINLYIDESVVNNIRLEYTTEHLFRVSENLFFKNLKFKFLSNDRRKNGD